MNLSVLPPESAAVQAHIPSWRSLGLKLAPPAVQLGHVLRAALCERIVRAQGQLTLLTAPAGFGKTTTLRQAHDHLTAQGVCCLWLTLDAADNDASRFTTGLQAAVHKAGMASPDPVHGMGSGDAIETLLLSDMPYALFLDEAEVLQDAAVLALLRELAERLPPQARFVMAARKAPSMGLARLRVRGRLTEIDAELLRFGPEEVQQLFAQAPQPCGINAQHLNSLWQKTEGWPAALSLAQLALQRSADPAGFVQRFSGSDRAVADYLSEDVLSGLPPPMQQFLLRTSILRQLDASICSALNPTVDCAAMLAELDAQHVFITPVDGAGRSWRYHSLFADFLRSQLERESPQAPARLHLAASSWYESHGRPVPAIDHAIEGGDLPHALHLMAQHAEALLDQGRMRLLSRWFAALPEALVQTQARLEVVAIWAMSLTDGPWLAMQRLERSLPVLDTPPLRAHARGMRTMFLAMQDRYDEALAAGNQAMPNLPTGEPFADATLLNAMAHVTSVFFGEHQVRPLLEASRALQLPDSNFNRMYSEAIVGMLDLLQGRLSQATTRFQQALGTTHTPKHPLRQGNAWAGVLYAYALYEADQLGSTQHLLNVYLPTARDTGLPDHTILGHVMRSRMALWQGDIDASHQALSELEVFGHQRHQPRVVAAAQLERMHHAVLRRQADSALAHLQAANDPAVWARERRQLLIANETQYWQLAQLRWQIAFAPPEQWPATDQALAQEMHLALQAGRQRRLLLLKFLRATIQLQMGQWDIAHPLLLKTLNSAASEGHVHLLLDEGWLLLPGLQRLRQTLQQAPEQPSGLTPASTALLHLLLGKLEAIYPNELCDEPASAWAEAATETPLTPAPPMPQAAHANHSTKAFSHAPPSPPTTSHGTAACDGLTQRELQVLHLLVEGYSNNAMAEKLFLSDSTVRTHLRNINQKLGARSRTHAVAMARKQGLVA